MYSLSTTDRIVKFIEAIELTLLLLRVNCFMTSLRKVILIAKNKQRFALKRNSSYGKSSLKIQKTITHQLNSQKKMQWPIKGITAWASWQLLTSHMLNMLCLTISIHMLHLSISILQRTIVIIPSFVTDVLYPRLINIILNLYFLLYLIFIMAGYFKLINYPKSCEV